MLLNYFSLGANIDTFVSTQREIADNFSHISLACIFYQVENTSLLSSWHNTDFACTFKRNDNTLVLFYYQRGKISLYSQNLRLVNNAP